MFLNVFLHHSLKEREIITDRRSIVIWALVGRQKKNHQQLEHTVKFTLDVAKVAHYMRKPFHSQVYFRWANFDKCLSDKWRVSISEPEVRNVTILVEKQFSCRSKLIKNTQAVSFTDWHMRNRLVKNKRISFSLFEKKFSLQITAVLDRNGVWNLAINDEMYYCTWPAASSDNLTFSAQKYHGYMNCDYAVLARSSTLGLKNSRHISIFFVLQNFFLTVSIVFSHIEGTDSYILFIRMIAILMVDSFIISRKEVKHSTYNLHRNSNLIWCFQ